jgi:hypothetical protein
VTGGDQLNEAQIRFRHAVAVQHNVRVRAHGSQQLSVGFGRLPNTARSCQRQHEGPGIWDHGVLRHYPNWD